MADTSAPVIDNPNDYPLTIVAVDGLGDECYRTQLDWSGRGRDLNEVPSADLGARRPRWVTYQVIDAHGKVVHSGENADAGKDDDGDLLEQKYGRDVHGTVAADELGNTGGRDGDAGDLQAEDPKKDVKESAKNTDEHSPKPVVEKGDEKAEEPKAKADAKAKSKN